MPALMAIIGGNANPLEREFKRVGLIAGALGNNIKHHLFSFIGAGIGIGGITAAMHKAVSTAEELVTASERLGIGAEKLQVLKRAATESNTELGILAKGFEKLDIAREKALKGDLKVMARFGQLGITTEMLQSMTSAQLFQGPMAAKALGMNQEVLGPILRDIFGKGFGELLPVLQTDFAELEKKMRETGAIMSSETLVKLKALGDELSFVSQIIVSHVGPALLKFGEMLYPIAAKIMGGFSATGAAIGAGFHKQSGAQITAQALKDFTPLAWVDFFKRRLVGGEGVGQAYKNAFLGENFDVKAAKEAGVESISETDKHLKEFETMLARMAEKANRLEHPVAAAFDEIEEETKAKSFRGNVNQLQRIGAYISPYSVTLIDVNKKMERHLKSIDSKIGPSHAVKPALGRAHF